LGSVPTDPSSINLFLSIMPSKQQNLKQRAAKALLDTAKATALKQLNKPRKPTGKKRSKLAKVGGFLGNFGKAALSTFLGSGDYIEGPFKVEKNSVIHPEHSNQVPHMHSGLGSVTVSHREYLRDITTGTTALPQGFWFVINPFNSAMFPWLSTLASNFEQYRIKGMVIEYISNSGNAVSSTNAALGSVSIATQYNTQIPNFSTKRALLNHYYAVSAAPSQNMVHAIECKDMYDPYKLYWVRVPNLNATYDSKLYDLGVVNVICQGSQSIYTAGEMWVTYEIELYKPRLPPPGAPTYTIDPDIGPLFPPGPDLSIHIPENQHPCCEPHDEEKDPRDPLVPT
jgi:hypothetical protein